MQQDAYGNWITPGTGWGETAAMASRGTTNLQAVPTSLQAPDTGSGDQRFGGTNVLGAVSSTYNQSQPQNTYDPAAAAAAAQRAESQKQIDAINRMLGLTNTSRQAGLKELQTGYNDRKASLASDQARTNQGYKDQTLQNEQARTRGYEQVDNFANTSQSNLQRIFQGANAGNSSVARLLAPHLVGKAAGSRRLGVTQTAGENAQGIAGAQEDANWQYKEAYADAERERKAQEKSFLRGIAEQESDLLTKRQSFEQDAGIANADTQAQIDKRFATLTSLFGKYAPTYSAKRMDFKKPELSKYAVDPAQLQLNNNLPAETRYYGTQLKKKQELK